MRIHRSALFSILFVSVAPMASAQGWIIPRPCQPPRCAPPPCRWERPCPPPRGGADVSRLSSAVHAELADRVIRYEVEEIFVNRGGVVGEADYFFPLPKGAAFEDLKLSINGELVAGETMDATEARRIYEDIVRQQRDPALVEWMGHGLLRTRIFPIAPGEKKKVVVRFQSVAEREGDALRVDYFRGGRHPGTIEPRPMMRDGRGGGDRERIREEGTAAFTLAYPAGGGLGAAYSPTHDLRTEVRGGRRHIEVRGDASNVTVLLPMRSVREPSISMLAHAPGREDGFALVTLTPPAMRAQRSPRDLTFVIDVSGSMAGEKIRQARAAGRQFLGTLHETDRFRIIDFATDVHSFRDEYVFATPANLAAAREYVDALDASGSTNISGALGEALDGLEHGERLSAILFVTDGEPTVGERSPDAIARRASALRGARRLFTFGVGADVNVALLEQLALEGQGTAHFVRPNESVERVVGLVANRLTSPVVTDLTVQADEGNVRLRKMHPGGAVDLFAGQDLVVLARYDGSGRARLRFAGRTANGPVSWTSTVDFPERSRANPFVARLWATQRIGWLSAGKRRGESNTEVDEEIRTLGERFGIPTEFSSYLVLEPGMVARRGDGALRLQAAPVTVSGTAAPAAAAGRGNATAGARDAAFESARRASVRREAKSLASADEEQAFARNGAPAARRAGNRIFFLRDSVWTDASAKDATPRITVRPYSAAYFELVDLLPELREPFALGDGVVVAGRRIVVAVAATGSERLSAEDRARLAADW